MRVVYVSNDVLETVSMSLYRGAARRLRLRVVVYLNVLWCICTCRGVYVRVVVYLYPSVANMILIK